MHDELQAVCSRELVNLAIIPLLKVLESKWRILFTKSKHHPKKRLYFWLNCFNNYFHADSNTFLKVNHFVFIIKSTVSLLKFAYFSLVSQSPWLLIVPILYCPIF